MLKDEHKKDHSLEIDLDQLGFRYLPQYAAFLLENRLVEFSKRSLDIARKLNVPLLKFLSSLSDEQLIEMGNEGNTQLLSAFIENKAYEYICESVKNWQENRLPNIESNDIVIEDISKVSYARRKVFRELLPDYTSDLQIYINVMEEVDRFTMIQDEISYKTLFDMKEQKIRENHHFIDKINNTSPGIIYVFDLLSQKEVYSNHKREELLGYSDDDMVAMGDKVLPTLLHPDDLPKLVAHVLEFANAGEGEIRTVEYRVKHKRESTIGSGATRLSLKELKTERLNRSLVLRLTLLRKKKLRCNWNVGSNNLLRHRK